MSFKQPQLALTSTLIVLLGAFSALAALSTDIYLPALSSMTQNLSATHSQAQLTLAIFFLGFGFGQLIFGPLSDSLGRRPVLLVGLYIYTFASIACMVSTHIEYLIVNRLLQAIGGCAAAVTSRAIIKDLSQGEQTAKALSAIMAVILIAPLIAPLIGSGILLFTHWQGIFFALSVYGVICIVCAHLWVKESHPPSKRQALHINNIFLGYLQVLKHKEIVLLLGADVAASTALLTFVTGSALLFSEYYGLNPQQFSVLFAMMTSSLLFGSFLSYRFISSKGVQWVIRKGLWIGISGSIIMLTICLTAPSTLWLVVLAIWICILPCIVLRAHYSALGLQYIPERTGVVSALFGALSLGIGGMSAIIIGCFNQFTPLIMAIMMMISYLISLVFYVIWNKKQHHKNII